MAQPISDHHPGELRPGNEIDLYDVRRGTEDRDPLSAGMAHLLVWGLRGKKARDNVAIYTAFVRVSINAVDNGWTWEEFAREVTVPQRIKRKQIQHVLWTQLLATSRHERHAHRQLLNAWESAASYIHGVGENHPEYRRQEALERAYAHTDRLEDGVDGLTPTLAKIMAYVIEQTEKRGWLRVTCPSRAVADAAGVSAVTASKGLRELAKRGLLVMESRGRWSPAGSTGSASVYSLADEAGFTYKTGFFYVNPQPTEPAEPDVAGADAPSSGRSSDDQNDCAYAQSASPGECDEKAGRAPNGRGVAGSEAPPENWPRRWEAASQARRLVYPLRKADSQGPGGA